MDYKEKYEMALKRAKQLSKELTVDDIVESIFPELKESEDEQSKKWILEYLYDGLRKSDEQFKGQFKAAIAWLENQDKHHIACSEEQMKVLDKVLNFAANHESPYWNNYIFETLNNFIKQLKN